MKIQRFNKQRAFKLFLMIFRLTVINCAFSIPINHIFGNYLFHMCVSPFPYGISLGFPPFYFFYLIEHQYVLHGFANYLNENLIVQLVGSTACVLLNIPNKIINYLFVISVLVIVFYLVSFLYCYISC